MNKNNEYFIDLLQSNSFIPVYRALMKILDGNQLIVLNLLIDKRQFFANRGELGSDGSFFIIDRHILSDFNIGQKALTNAKKKLVEKEFVNIKKRGIPQKTFYIINVDKIQKIFMNFTMNKYEKSPKNANQNRQKDRLKIDQTDRLKIDQTDILESTKGIDSYASKDIYINNNTNNNSKEKQINNLLSDKSDSKKNGNLQLDLVYTEYKNIYNEKLIPSSTNEIINFQNWIKKNNITVEQIKNKIKLFKDKIKSKDWYYKDRRLGLDFIRNHYSKLVEVKKSIEERINDKENEVILNLDKFENAEKAQEYLDAEIEKIKQEG